jgi:dynein heavy chain, axonemal
MTLMGAL